MAPACRRMSVLIQANLHHGKPRLEVLDAHSGHLRMAWQADGGRQHAQDDLHALFRKLMLVSEIDQGAAASSLWRLDRGLGRA